MKSNEKIPSAQFDYIGDIIKEREQKSLPTYYTISIEQYDKTTPVAEKEAGYENFKQQILKYTSDYNLSSITVSIFSGKSRNVKAFQTFKVLLNKQTPTVVFGNSPKEHDNIEQIESAIPVSRYYDEKFELQMRIMRTEMEKQSLTERLVQLTERYEDKLKEQGRYNEEKIKQLEQDILELEQEIRDFEKEISKNEKDKHNSFGNIALGSISARAIENLAKSNIGTGVLKGLLGKEGFETLQGHLAGIEQESDNDTPTTQTARIITEPTNSTDPRQIVMNYIQKVAQSLPDRELRMLYDLAELTEKNIKDLEVLWNVSQQIKQQRTKTTSKNPDTISGTNEEEDNDDLTKID